MTDKDEQVASEIERIKKGGVEKYHLRNREQQKFFVRDRLKLLLDDGKIEFEDGMFAEHWDELNTLELLQQLGALPQLSQLGAP